MGMASIFVPFYVPGSKFSNFANEINDVALSHIFFKDFVDSFMAISLDS